MENHLKNYNLSRKKKLSKFSFYSITFLFQIYFVFHISHPFHNKKK